VTGTASGVDSGDVDPGAGVSARGFAAYTYTGSYASLIENYIFIPVVPEPAVSIFPMLQGLLPCSLNLGFTQC
jgi:hypothetical protein